MTLRFSTTGSRSVRPIEARHQLVRLDEVARRFLRAYARPQWQSRPCGAPRASAREGSQVPRRPDGSHCPRCSRSGFVDREGATFTVSRKSSIPAVRGAQARRRGDRFRPLDLAAHPHRVFRGLRPDSETPRARPLRRGSTWSCMRAIRGRDHHHEPSFTSAGIW